MDGRKVDIEGIIKDWALDYFRRKASRKERKLIEHEQLGTEVDWRRVKFIHDPPVYDPEPTTGVRGGGGHPINNTLFQTSFTNKTDSPQRYTFRTERTTRSSCALQIEQGYTKGVEMNIKLTTPCQILEANAGFKQELSVFNSESETIEEELTWSVDSEIEVKERHIAEAKLTVVEEQYNGRFTLATHISGRARAVFTNIADNNSFIKAIEGDVIDIVKQAISAKSIQASEAISIDGANRCVLCKTRGTCKFKYGVKQQVEVDQVPIR